MLLIVSWLYHAVSWFTRDLRLRWDTQRAAEPFSEAHPWSIHHHTPHQSPYPARQTGKPTGLITIITHIYHISSKNIKVHKMEGYSFGGTICCSRFYFDFSSTSGPLNVFASKHGRRSAGPRTWSGWRDEGWPLLDLLVPP